MAICTDPFRAPAEAMADVYGMPGFAFISMPHPIASLTAAEVEERVQRLIPDVLRILGARDGRRAATEDGR